MNASKGKIRLLIVDDNPDTQENLTKMLYFEKDIEIVGRALGGREAIEKAQQLKPDLALVDINMPDMDGIKTTEALLAKVSSLRVVIMSVQGEQDYLRRAMLVGASDYLTKPFTSDELVNSLRTVYLREGRRPPERAYPATPSATLPSLASEEPRQARIVTIFSPKGGVGRTTIAVNLAVALRQETGKRVGLLDGSLLFGDVAVMLNLSSKKSIVDLVSHAAELDDEILEDIMVGHPSGIKVLLAPPRPEMAELFTAEHMNRILERMRRLFDFIVIDTMTSFGEVTLAILDSSDDIIVVTSLEMPALKNIKLFFETAEALGYQSKRISLVVNRSDSSGGISVRDVESNVNQSIAVSIVNDWKLATLAVNRGVPLILSHRESLISRNILQLARLVVAEETEAMARGKGAAAKPRGLAAHFTPFLGR